MLGTFISTQNNIESSKKQHWKRWVVLVYKVVGKTLLFQNGCLSLRLIIGLHILWGFVYLSNLMTFSNLMCQIDFTSNQSLL